MTTTALADDHKKYLNGDGRPSPFGALAREILFGDLTNEILTRLAALEGGSFDGSIVADTVDEVTAGAGVTVDGCLIKDGRAANLATAAMFVSAEQTGTGSSQDVAHGFGSVPSLVVAIPSDITGGAYVVAYGVHDATNVKVTVTSGEKFKILALR